VKEHYEALIGPSVDVLHVQGRQLKELLVSNDVGMLFYPNSQYRALAMPAKVFEYLEAGLPIIATKDTAAGGFVAANGCGWALSFSRDELVHLLSSLRDDRERLITKGLHCLDVARNNTWVHRAEKVAEVLGAI
jgi:glycosyltransferase involved in cell wall biosynthesis